jgi:hypothetical protein
MGEDVKNVLVDGKEFFGNDPKVATRNLPADAINKVQLYDRDSDESRFTGIDDGERNQTLNLVLDENKKSGIFGDMSVGAGTGNHSATAGKVYRFTEKTQLAALGMYNNINQFGFSLSDYISFNGGLAAFSSGDGHVMIGGDNSIPVNFGQPVFGTGSNGAAGLNFSVSGSKNNRLFASYLGSGSKRRLFETSSTRNFIPGGSFRMEESISQEKRDTTNKLNFGLRKQIGEKQNIIINGSMSYNTSGNPLNSLTSSFLNDLELNNQERNSGEQTCRLAFNSDASYLLKINEGKTIFRLAGRTNYSGNNADTRFLNRTEYYSPIVIDLSNQFFDVRSSSGTYSGSLSLTQRLTKRSFIDVSLMAGRSIENLNRKQGDIEDGYIPDQSLSPDFLKEESYFRPGLTWKLSTTKSRFMIGLLSDIGKYVSTLNEDGGLAYSYFFLIPRSSWEFDYRSGRRLMFDYTATVNTPRASQLLPVVNNINSLSLFYGNRDLGPEYVHNGRFSWWLFDQYSFTTLLTGLNIRYTGNKIAYSREVGENLAQVVSLLNVKDDWNAGGNIDFSTPIKPLGVKVNFSISENFNRGRSLVNGTENINNSLIHRFSLTVDNRKKDKWDIETGSSVTITDTRYSVQNTLNNVFNNISWFAGLRYTPGVRFNIMTSADITSYSAKSFNESQLVPLLGAEVNYYFLKNQRAVITLSGVDLLNRNSGIERRSEMNYLLERRSDIIGRYVLLSFKYRLNKVGDNTSGIDIKIKNR